MNMLESLVLRVISQCDNYEELNFMQDGAPPRSALSIHAWLDNQYTGQWIGRGGPTEQFPRSPDLTTRDFLFCGLDQRRSLTITTTNN